MSNIFSWLATIGLLVIIFVVWYAAKRNQYKKLLKNNQKVCPQCGEKLAIDAKFCRICGIKQD